jgi:hypothetical protein
MQWGGSPVVGAPPTWLPPPLAGFWLPSGLGFWHPPPHLYPGHPGGTAPPQMGQGYWSSPTPWGSPPGGQAPLPFGSPPLRTPSLRSTTSTLPTVRQAYVKIGFIYLLNYFAFLTRSFTCLFFKKRSPCFVLQSTTPHTITVQVQNQTATSHCQLSYIHHSHSITHTHQVLHFATPCTPDGGEGGLLLLCSNCCTYSSSFTASASLPSIFQSLINLAHLLNRASIPDQQTP